MDHYNILLKHLPNNIRFITHLNTFHGLTNWGHVNVSFVLPKSFCITDVLYVVQKINKLLNNQFLIM